MSCKPCKPALSASSGSADDACAQSLGLLRLLLNIYVLLLLCLLVFAVCADSAAGPLPATPGYHTRGGEEDCRHCCCMCAVKYLDISVSESQRHLVLSQHVCLTAWLTYCLCVLVVVTHLRHPPCLSPGACSCSRGPHGASAGCAAPSWPPAGHNHQRRL